MRKTLLLIGAVSIFVGVVWIGQGTGYFPYPPESFMTDQTPWAYRGLGLAVAGLIAVMVGRRLPR